VLKTHKCYMVRTVNRSGTKRTCVCCSIN